MLNSKNSAMAARACDPEQAALERERSTSETRPLTTSATVVITHPRRPAGVVETLRTEDPTRVGPYRLMGRIGTGGMGVVYLGKGRDGLAVAVKLPRPELVDDEEFRRRFRSEANVAQRVSDRHVARVVAAQLDGPCLWMATEYIDGPDLARAVLEAGPMSGAQLGELAAGLAEALVAIHGAGIVHRDLKPANVLLAPDGVKVVDFGIARAVEATILTRAGVVVGSAGYLAPEQVTGNNVGPEADVFAWSATVAFAATGRPPFGEGPVDAVLYRVAHESPEVPHIEAPLAGLVASGFAKDPALRPTPTRIVDELRTFLRIAPIATTESRRQADVVTTTSVLPRLLEPARRPRPRRRSARLIGALLAVGVVAAGGGAIASRILEGGSFEPGQYPTTTTVVRATTTVPSTTVPTIPPTPGAAPLDLHLRVLTAPFDADLPVGLEVGSVESVSGTASSLGGRGAVAIVLIGDDFGEGVLIYQFFDRPASAQAFLVSGGAEASSGRPIVLPKYGLDAYCGESTSGYSCITRMGSTVMAAQLRPHRTTNGEVGAVTRDVLVAASEHLVDLDRAYPQ